MMHRQYQLLLFLGIASQLSVSVAQEEAYDFVVVGGGVSGLVVANRLIEDPMVKCPLTALSLHASRSCNQMLKQYSLSPRRGEWRFPMTHNESERHIMPI
jgi:glycine/D-amino acid oxidase-like deaminating enzyme